MSINIYIFARRKVTVKKKNGKSGRDTQTIEFDAIQTPSEVSSQIMKSSDPAQAYVDWVLSHYDRDEQVAVYGYEPDGKFIGTKTLNIGRDHVKQLRDWIEQVKEEGYTVSFEMI
jgi:hypothetical protein